MSEREEEYLNDIWSLYFHASADPDWTLSSYVRLTDISTVNEFLLSAKGLEDKVQDNMFFLMREGIYPCWDDPNNMYGACLCLKFAKQDVVKAWKYMGSRVLGETVMKERSETLVVNGISISPKKNYSILKIWLKDVGHSSTDHYIVPSWYNGEVIFKSNLENIQANTQRLMTKVDVEV